VNETVHIKPGILPTGAATPVKGGVLEAIPEKSGNLVPLETVTSPAPPRRFRWGLALGASTALAIAGVTVIDAVAWLSDLFQRSIMLGGIAAFLLGGVLVAAAGFTLGEIRNLMRLRSAQEIRQRGHELTQATGTFESHGFVADLVELVSGGPRGRELCEQFRDALTDTHDDREALLLFDRMVLRPLDETALAMVRRGARDAAIGTSVSPVAGLDAMIVIWRSLRMMREIGAVYGLRPTRLAIFALARRMLLTATFSVTTDMVGDIVGAHLGGRLAGLLSGKLAEGIYAGVRTARLGLLTVDQCRPLPFGEGNRPNLRQLVSQSLETLAPPADSGT
jgi:putative membrane protein